MVKRKNEGLTERLTYELFEEKGFLKSEIIPKKTKNELITKLLRNASKKGNNRGEPDFFVINKNSDLIIIVECKPDIEHHKSEIFGNNNIEKESTASYACDGVVHYASFLKDCYDVIAIAISGEDRAKCKVDTFYWKKNDEKYIDLCLDEIRTFCEYSSFVYKNTEKIKIQYSELMEYSRILHSDMREYANLTEAEKPLLVSGILIGLQDEEFSSNYIGKDSKGEYLLKDENKKNPNKTLANSLYSAIESVLIDKEVPKHKITSLMSVYSFIKAKQEFRRAMDKGINENPLRKFIKEIDEKVRPFVSDIHSLDIVGRFYGEFIKYTGGDGKGLGIVLTPNHITELFCKIANLTPQSKVLDICTGTASFLIAAMKDMIQKANGNEELIKNIKRENLIGVEQQPNMFALACSNMILRQDGKSNLHMGSCFDFQNTIKSYNCNVGMMNPPYAQKGEGLSELDFIRYMLNCLVVGGIGIAIVPMSCAIDTNKSVVALKETILQRHTLRAVMSMPDELFYPIGTIPCIMVFEVGISHYKSDKQTPRKDTWFGYWKDDGFIKTKKDGRIDLNHKWCEIEEEWLNLYHNNKEKMGLSVLNSVTSRDEWCAEAYMETDYSKLTQEMFEEELKKYAIFVLSNKEK
ncbi:HsdM family class I SAM-dependent methyltransferase [Clostridium tertium]|uniref:HsdM family class I SAM-dependent methyltransferase n=1 Tax=Clostridium tertium TaxID=1559 RepID=UPI0022E1A914|nr:N-6 DNA methylase [Clostridium tertium]